MEKLNKMIEIVVEKTVGRFLPEVEAKAGCTFILLGCCGSNQAEFLEKCDSWPYYTYYCQGVCPQ